MINSIMCRLTAVISSKHTLRAKRKLTTLLWSVVRTLLLVGICYMVLYPMLVRISVAFMTREDLNDVTVRWVPRHFTLDNMRIAWEKMEFVKALANTTILSGVVTAISLIACTLAAYGFARHKFFGRELLFGLVIFTLVVPPQTNMVPLYMQFYNYRMLGGMSPFFILAATCSGIRNGLYIYICRQTFRAMPNEIEEAAIVDGSGALRTFFTIMLPNAVPTLVTVGLISFVWQWNDTFYSTLLSPTMKLLSSSLVGIVATITDFFGGNWQNIDFVYASMLINAGSLLLISPLVLLYLFAQKSFVQSVERSGIIG